MKNRAAVAVWLSWVSLALLAACAEKDPEAKLREARARWEVEALGVVEGGEGMLNVSVRVAGPPRSELDQLTVRIELFDADRALLANFWHTFDVSAIPLGAATEISVRVPSPEREVSGVRIDRVLHPTQEEAAHIPELKDLAG